MDTAFIVFHLLVLCGGNAVQFPGLHLFMLSLFCFAWDLILCAWLCCYDQTTLELNFIMDFTGKRRKYTIFMLHFLVSWTLVVMCCIRELIKTHDRIYQSPSDFMTYIEVKGHLDLVVHLCIFNSDKNKTKLRVISLSFLFFLAGV